MVYHSTKKHDCQQEFDILKASIAKKELFVYTDNGMILFGKEEKMDKKLFKSLLLLVTVSIVLVAAIVKIDWILGLISTCFSLLSPLFIGIAIAFILNPLCNFLTDLFAGKYFRKKRSAPQKTPKWIKPAAIAASYLVFFAIIAVIILLFIPSLMNSINLFIQNFNGYLENLQQLFGRTAEWLNIEETLFSGVEKLLNEIIKNFPQIITGVFPKIFDLTKNVASAITNTIVGLILSIYILTDKKKLMTQCKRLSQAIFPENIHTALSETMALSIKTFSGFLSARLIDSLIVGVLCFLFMLIFRWEYPMMISVIIGVTNVIPVFGPFLGAIPSIFILLMVDPMQAVWFTVFILVLQQLDGNVIGPKVTGESIDLPPIWTMVATFIGGGLFGIAGMLIGVPLFAVIYAIIQKETLRRLNQKDKEQKQGKKPSAP